MKLKILLLVLACLLGNVPSAFAGSPSSPTLPTRPTAKLNKVQKWLIKKIAKKIQKRAQKQKRVREDGFWYFLLGLSPIVLGIWLIARAFSFTSGFLAILITLLGVGLIVVGAILLAEAIDIFRRR